MNARDLRKLKREVSNWVWSLKRIARGTGATVLFITQKNGISDAQVFPYYFFRATLMRDLGFDFCEVSLADYQSASGSSRYKADIVFFQPWWNIEPVLLQSVLQKIRNENPDVKIVFLDSFAPLDLRLAQFLDTSIDVYIKKQAFRDRSIYGKTTRGDTNLVDYYGKLYELEYQDVTFPIPEGFLDKLVVGPGFATAEFLLPTFLRLDRPISCQRNIDLHSRLGGTGKDWYGSMRDHARITVENISGIRTVTSGAVNHRRYMQELQSAKICFSPFGYGEVCWRDYEAVMCGALLVKPDMSHVETDPDIYRPFETYIPVRWDFSDLEEKVRYYLKNKNERDSIVQNAYQVLSRYFVDGGFLKHVQHVLGK